jgi:hypothetical protein
MEPIQYTASVVTRNLLRGSLAMSAMPDAPVLPVRPSRRRRLTDAWDTAVRPMRGRRLAVRHRPVREHPTPISG